MISEGGCQQTMCLLCGAHFADTDEDRKKHAAVCPMKQALEYEAAWTEGDSDDMRMPWTGPRGGGVKPTLGEAKATELDRITKARIAGLEARIFRIEQQVQRLLNNNLASLLKAWEDEHGPIDEEELERIRAEWPDD